MLSMIEKKIIELFKEYELISEIITERVNTSVYVEFVADGLICEAKISFLEGYGYFLVACCDNFPKGIWEELQPKLKTL